MATKSVSSTVDADLLQKAQEMTGTGQAEMVRRALQHFVATGGPVALAAKPVADMSDAEELASMRLLLKASDAIGDSIVYLVGEEAVADTDEKKRLRIIIADLKADKAKIDARITALTAGQLTMAPPSAEQIDRISQLAEEVGELTRNAQQADLVIGAVKQVVKIWTGTQV